MSVKLPENIDFGPKIIEEAIAAQVALVQRGIFDGQNMYVDGLTAAGIDPEFAIDYANAICAEPEVRDRLNQAAFATGFAVGSAALTEAEISSERVTG